MVEAPVNAPDGIVLTYPAAGLPRGGHERATHAALAQRIAALLGYDFGGELERDATPAERRYLVPSDALLSSDATALGVRSRRDLFGAVVPHAFVATKSITHPLVEDAAVVPQGWSASFADAVGEHVLRGYAAFSRDDARNAACRLLAAGPVRLKRATGIGGTGQWVLDDAAAVDEALARIDEAELGRYGCVVEEQLEDVATVSVGRVEVGHYVATYCGVQHVTRNRDGTEVYGGSDLLVARGELDALLRRALPSPLREAVHQAQRYDAAAEASFPGFFASRRNYDVAQGVDRDGVARSGVLEQSWRIGGASGAEIAALAAFASDPALGHVRARCVEVHGDDAALPAEADVYYDGTDPRVGRLVKYALVDRDADA